MVVETANPAGVRKSPRLQEKFSKDMPESPGSGTSTWKDQGGFELETLIKDDDPDPSLDYIPPPDESLEGSSESSTPSKRTVTLGGIVTPRKGSSIRKDAPGKIGVQDPSTSPKSAKKGGRR